MQEIKIKDLKFAKYNPRIITEEEFEGLKTSLKTFGQVENIIINKDNTIISGHQRARAWKELGHDTITALVLDLPKKKEKKLNVVMNSQAISGKYDDQLLSEILEEIKLDDDYKDLRLDVLEPLDLSEEVVLPEEGQDNVPELKKEPFVVRGDIFEIKAQGLKYRVGCLDSTSVDDVEKLMDGEKADMVFTDPPYNGDVSNAWDNQWKDWNEFKTFINNTVFQFDVNIFFVFGNWKSSNTIFQCATQNKLNFLQEIIWMKPSSVGMLNWFPKITEYAQVFFKNKDVLINNVEATRIEIEEDFLPKSDLRKSMYEKARRGDFDNSQVKQKLADKFNVENGVKPKNVWYFKNLNGGYGFGSNKKNSDYSEHTTIKPIKLCERGVIAFSSINGLIIDLFAGSGSTLIACIKTKRNCFTCDIDEHYTQVTVTRAIKFLQDNNIEFEIKLNDKEFDLKQLYG